jgi:curved DNA-binding protein CbpA
MTDTDFYRLLQVDPDADLDVIRAAHRVLTSRLHPERDQTGIDEIRLAEYDRAMAVLADPFRRTAYDQQREFEMHAMGPGVAPDSSANGWNAAANGHAGSTIEDQLPRLAQGALTERLQAGQNGAHLAMMVLDFGRYAGWTLGELARQDPDYLRWLSRHSSGIRYRSAILRLLAEATSQRVPLHVQR